MAFRTLILAGAAIAAATVLVPAGASAQKGFTAPPAYSSQFYGYASDRTRGRDGYPRAGSRRDGYARDAYFEEQPQPRHVPDRERRERCDRDSAGSLLGAIAGGMLGDGGGGSRPLRGRDADRGCD